MPLMIESEHNELQTKKVTVTQTNFKTTLKYMASDPSLTHPFLRWYFCLQISLEGIEHG